MRGMSGTPARAMSAAITQAQAELASFADPSDATALQQLLRMLYALGRRDLPLGRLFEGHVDALQIIARYAAPDLADAAVAAARQGATFGVWNAGLPGEPLRLAEDALFGGKSYASGAGILSHVLVTADTDAGPQLLLLDLARVPPRIDAEWWEVIGMARSQTHIVRWDGAPVDAAARIGAPQDYIREPWFSGGALRFVAVHAGGVAALFDQVRDHLNATGRAADPHQRARLADLFGLADLAASAVRVTATAWFAEPDATRLPRVAAARLQVADLAQRAILLAQEAVGLQGLFHAHPLSATLTDLMVYLRQPAPDAQRAKVGAAAAAGDLGPKL